MRKLFIILLTAISVAISAQTTYYIDATAGDDDNTGLSPAQAWQTIAHLSSETTLGPGDSVLFKAGERWFEQFSLAADEEGERGNLLTISRYGEGANPQILGSTVATSWDNYSGNVWVSTNGFSSPVGRNSVQGSMFIYNTEDSIIHCGRQRSALGDLDQEFEWIYSGGYIYLYSPEDPDTRYNEVHVSQRATSITYPFGNNDNQSWLCIDGVDMMFGINAGLSFGYPGTGGAEGLCVRNCKIGYISIPGSSYGYGIEGFHSNVLFENNEFSDCGRRAVSFNLYVTQPAGSEIHIDSVIVRNNTFSRGYHTSSLDFSLQLSQTDTVTNVFFYNNIIDERDITSIWPNATSNQIFFQAGGDATFIDEIYIVGNVFAGATARNILLEGGDGNHYIWNNSILGHNTYQTASPWYTLAASNVNDIDFRNNIHYDPTPSNWAYANYGMGVEDSDDTTEFSPMDYNLHYTVNPANGNGFIGGYGIGWWDISEWATYRSTYPQWDANSPTPSDPYFVDFANKDYHLTDSSPAIGAGVAIDYVIVTDLFGVVDTINKYDIDGKEYNRSSMDLGAYSYSEPDSSLTYITAFNIANQVSSTIDTTEHTVDIVMPYGTNVTSLTPTITVSQAATIDPASGVAQNFTNPVTYTVTAGNEVDEQEYTVTVDTEEALTDTDITAFTITGQIGNSVINSTAHTVRLTMPRGTDPASLSPTITLSEGATVSPTSGTATDFTTPATYTVTAQDGTTEQEWTVTVVVSTDKALSFRGRQVMITID